MKPHCALGMAAKVGVCLSALSGISGCSFGDLFRSAGPHDVTINFVGDSVLFGGSAAAFSVTVSTNGTPISNPSLTLESSDTSVFTINAARDSLVAVGTGTAHLTARLNDPMFTDSLPTLSVRIRVHG